MLSHPAYINNKLWSTLCHENRRLNDIISAAGGVVADLMCGIGPFAIPLAVSGVTVRLSHMHM